jgi:outer membrane lipoprotein SlyB
VVGAVPGAIIGGIVGSIIGSFTGAEVGKSAHNVIVKPKEAKNIWHLT